MSTENIDVERARADTPGCAGLVHLNNAGAALPPAVVTGTVVDYLRAEALRGSYELAAESAEKIAGVYASVARLIGAGTEDIALFDSATTAWQSVFYSIPFASGARILTCRTEYASNAIAYLQVARRTGAEVVFVGEDERGGIDLADLAAKLDERVKLISLNHVPTHSGLVNPAEQVGELAERAGVPFLLDACQSAGQLDLDVARLRCSALTATGRKYLRAPRGTGFLYVSPRLRANLEPDRLDLGAATWTGPGEYTYSDGADRFESWERNFGTVLGLGAAVDYALDLGLPAIERRVTALAAGLRERLAAVPGVTVRDRGERLCGIVTFDLAGVPPVRVKEALAAAGVNVSVTLAGGAQLDLSARGLPDLVRASVHYYNTEAELDTATALVAGLPR